MCGIVGVYNFNKKSVSRVQIKKMTDILAHRGPDDEGVYIDDFVGLGHRRLSIIDLSPAGHQPMSNKNQNIWITYNGEIYNFKELRKNLEKKGYIFKSNTDTEVLIYLYEEYGENCVSFIRGMFAFAIWDKKKDKFILFRDRLGIKPLYYWTNDKSFVFSSEIKAILTHPSVQKKVNLDSLYNHLIYRFSPSPQTIFEKIFKLPPGHSLVCKNGKITIKQYWNLPKIINSYSELSEKLYIEKIYKLLREQINSRLISDVPLGAFLSGGLDSSSIVGLMSGLSSNPVKTYSVGFDINDSIINELNYAKKIADRFQTDHHELLCKTCSPELLKKVVWHLEEPLIDPAVIPTYLVAQLASKEVKVVLTGEGSDETNGGYEKYLKDYRYGGLLSLYSKIPWRIRSTINSSFLTNRSHMLNRLQALNTNKITEVKKFSWLSYDFWKEIDQNNFLSPELKNKISDRVDPFQKILKDSIIPTKNRFSYLDLKSWLPDDLLLKVDKMTMAHSLEARVPYLDHEYVAFALSIPANLKFKNNQSKYLLRQAMRKILPQEIVERRQHGFIVPTKTWIDGNLKDFVQDTLTDKKTQQRGYFNNQAIHKLLSNHFNKKISSESQIWGLLMLELWHRAFIDN